MTIEIWCVGKQERGFHLLCSFHLPWCTLLTELCIQTWGTIDLGNGLLGWYWSCLWWHITYLWTDVLVRNCVDWYSTFQWLRARLQYLQCWCTRYHSLALNHWNHYNDVIMGAVMSQITGLMIVYSTVYSDADQRKHQSSASLAFVWEIHGWPVNSPHKWPVMQKMFPFDDVIMWKLAALWHHNDLINSLWPTDTI